MPGDKTADNKKVIRRFLFILSLLLLAGCKSPPPERLPAPERALPPPGGEIDARLSLEKAEFHDIDRVELRFVLTVENPGSRALELRLGGWGLSLDGGENPAGSALDFPALPPRIGAGSTGAIPLGLALELPREDGGAGADHAAKLRLDLVYTPEGGGVLAGTAEAAVSFPRIREPVFTITGISIMKADLINTRFKVRLRIENPNAFPLELSALNYELYGTGRFWAGGVQEEPLPVAPLSFAEAELALVMNFINMRRELLDQVIAQKEIPYRFTGSAEIGTPLEQLPRFRMAFDRSGLSAVEN